MDELLWMAIGSLGTILVAFIYIGIDKTIQQRREEQALWQQYQNPSEIWLAREVERQRNRNIDDME